LGCRRRPASQRPAGLRHGWPHAFTRAVAYACCVATTVRVSEATRARAAALAASRGRSIGEVVDEALEALETAEFWRKTQEALRRRPVELDEDPAPLTATTYCIQSTVSGRVWRIAGPGATAPVVGACP